MGRRRLLLYCLEVSRALILGLELFDQVEVVFWRFRPHLLKKCVSRQIRIPDDLIEGVLFLLLLRVLSQHRSAFLLQRLIRRDLLLLLL